MRATVSAGAVAAAVLLLAACGTGGADPAPAAAERGGSRDGTSSTGERSEQPSEPTPPDSSAGDESTAPADGPPFPDDTQPQVAEPEGEWDLQLEDVRVGEHDGFDRLVLEFRGSGTPGWGVHYDDRAVQEGSGDVVTLAGDSVLTIAASGTALPDASSYDVPQRLGPAGGISEVYVNGWFEGYTQVFAGVEGARAPFRVFTLTDPPRLVVDVSR